MLTTHHVTGFLVIVVCVASATAAFVAYRRRQGAGKLVAQLLALAQTVLVAQVALGLLLLGDHRRAADHLHYLYGSLALLAALAPWMYAPTDARRRLGWFGGATLLAGPFG